MRLDRAIKDQMAGKTTLIEVLLNQELGEPFRRDAMDQAQRGGRGSTPADMHPQQV